jgi:hypothetical protein
MDLIQREGNTKSHLKHPKCWVLSFPAGLKSWAYEIPHTSRLVMKCSAWLMEVRFLGLHLNPVDRRKVHTLSTWLLQPG